MDAQRATNEVRPQPPRPVLDPQLVERKIARYFELCDLAQELAMAGIKHRHPDASPQELRRLFAERLAIFREGKWGRK
jgi:hypothetical protein